MVGHDDGVLRQGLPPLPPHIHSFVYRCHRSETEAFTRRLDFLRLLLTGAGPAADEVVTACLVQVAAANPDRRGFLVRAGKMLASELAGELPRLNALLGRISP